MTQNIIDLRRILESFIKMGFNDENYESLFSGVFTIDDVISDIMYIEFRYASVFPLIDPHYNEFIRNKNNWFNLNALEEMSKTINSFGVEVERIKERILSECRNNTYEDSTLKNAINSYCELKTSIPLSINTEETDTIISEIAYWFCEMKCSIEFIYNIVVKSIENNNAKLYDSYFRINTFSNLRNAINYDKRIRLDYSFELFFTRNRYINLIANEKTGSYKYRIEEDRWFCLQDMLAKILPKAAIGNNTLTEWIIINTTPYDWLSFFKEYSALNHYNSIKLQFSEVLLNRFYAAYKCIDDWDYDSNDS